jgi:Lrp/AsnC family transcriptional regulator, leucine-responsive regulatory protein
MINFVSLLGNSTRGAGATATNIDLDASDRAILGALNRNARISYRELAKLAHLSPNAAAERVRRLQRLGVIKGFAVDIEPSLLGLNLQAFIDVKLQKGTTMDGFERTVVEIVGVQDAMAITGAFDVRLRVVCKDAYQLGELIEQLRMQSGVQETSSTIVTKQMNLSMGGERGRDPLRRRPAQ